MTQITFVVLSCYKQVGRIVLLTPDSRGDPPEITIEDLI